MATGYNRAFLPLFCLFPALSPVGYVFCDVWKETGFDAVFGPGYVFNGQGIEADPHQLL